MQVEREKERILILAASGDEGDRLAARLRQAGLTPEKCDNVSELCDSIEYGAGAAVICEEALEADDMGCLEHVLNEQPEWSDFALIGIGLAEGKLSISPQMAEAIERGMNLLVLPHSVDDNILVNAVRVTLKCRRRQYILRDRLHEQFQHEEELRNNETLFRLVFDNAAVAIALVDLEGFWIRVNDRLCEIVGYDRDELAQRSLHQITHPDDLEHSRAAHRRLIKGRASSYAFEKRYLCKNGTIVWVNVSMVLVRDSAGRPAYFVSVFDDITARKAAEQLLKSLNASLENRVAERTAALEAQTRQLRLLASQLAEAEQRERSRLAGVLHDGLQQLIVAAQMRLQSCRRQIPPSAGAAMDRVRDLLNESIGVSRSLVVELSPPVLQHPDIAPAIEWLGSWFREKHDLAVETDIGPDLPSVPHNIKVALFQAAREVLFNVVKHSGVREAELEVRFDNDRLHICVQDQGRGFAVDEVYRSQTQPGYGLFSVRERMQAIGGEFWISSSPDTGTRVDIVSPSVGEMHVVAPAAEAEARGEAPAPGSVGACIRIVVADDHRIVREGLASILDQQPDMEIVGEAVDGYDAIAKTDELTPDVVIMDVSMPRLNGFEATRRIRQTHPEVQIIALSMHEEAQVCNAMMKAGAVGYLQKDGPSDLLFSTIRKFAQPATAERRNAEAETAGHPHPAGHG